MRPHSSASMRHYAPANSTVVVEQTRLMQTMLKIIQEKDRNAAIPLCNANTCPSMSAGE